MDGLEALVARPIADLIEVRDARAPLRVLVASLAPGGAERIVLEWLAAERSHGRPAELAVLHARRNALAVPQGVAVRVRSRESPEAFVKSLAAAWRDAPAPVSTHLVQDPLLALLWAEGVRTVPTVHNVRDGWRNDPRAWNAPHVPLVVACADAVKRQLLEAGCRVPVVTLRHRPRVGASAFDGEARARLRAELGIAPGTFLLGAAGAIKPQKDYARAIDVLAALRVHRDAALVILGGVLDRARLAELDRVMERAVRRRVTAHVRLPGFVPAIDPWLAACDALLNVSRYEGLSMAVQEALAAGLPVVATDVGGQSELSHPALERVAPDASPKAIAARLVRHPVRSTLVGAPLARAPRAGSLALGARAAGGRRIDTLLVTANLNAGGAQRSLVNLARAIAPCHRIAVAVCGETTHATFASELREAGIEVFRPAPSADPFATAESLLAHAGAAGASSLAFWNVDARVKLLAAQFAPPALRLADVSPGNYAFREMEAADGFAESVATSRAAYYARLDMLVLKYHGEAHPACRRVAVIPNGVAPLARAPSPPAHARFLVSGRIAPSKRLEDIFAAFARVHALHPAAELHVFGCVEERHREYAARLVRGAGTLPIRFRGASFAHAHLAEPFTAAVVLGTHQGSPNAVLEAMAAGIAVIANASGGTRELVAHGATGWLLAEDASVDDLAAAMLEASAQPRHTAAVAERGRERVRAEFTLEAMARRYLEVLGADAVPRHEKMAPWNSASVPAVPLPSLHAASPATPVP